MRTNNYIIGSFLALLMFLTSCTDFVEPIIPYKDFDTGAYLRTIARTSTTFNFFDIPNSRFAITIEAVDAEDGRSVEKVDVLIRHLRVVPGVGQVFTPAQEVRILTLNASDFQPNNESRFLRATINIPAAQVVQAVGLTVQQLRGGDFFDFRLVLTDKKGRVFSNNNMSPDLNQPFYNSPFLYRVPLVCPSNLGGTFAFSTTNIVAGAGGNAGACGGTVTGTVTLTPVSGSSGAYTLSDASFGVFGCAWGDTPPGGSLRLNDSCGVLSFSGTDKYGDTYTFQFVSNDGRNLIFNWTNSYGDGGRTTLTAPAGFTWPALLR